MGGYTAKLARRIKEQGAGGSSPLILAEYVSPSAIRIGGELFSHNVHGYPQCVATAGDTVLAAQIGSSFYVICREV